MSPEDHALLMKAGEAGLLKDLRWIRVSLTGKLSMPRADMVSLIRACNGVYDEHPRPGTRYLIVGDTARFGRTNKMREAERRGTEIISESDFVRMIAP